jgi:nitrate reductase (NAD(P)H)
MMPEYHIGTLDEASKAKLGNTEEEAEEDLTRPVFLQSKAWSKAILSSKVKVSADSKIFTFDLNHAEQAIGLPIGQHLMMRLRDPATREAIIRAYTPLSECTEKGQLRVLIKIYYDTLEAQGGKMTQALDSIPIGHFVDFKGPVGKFEYLGNGLCTISGKERRVNRFIMICGGSGITPIFQVYRAVMQNKQDSTKCLVMDGNRVEEDILCKQELDSMASASPEKADIIYTLSKPSPSWTGLEGRMDQPLFEKHIGKCSNTDGDNLVLICGPESMEASVRSILTDMGWGEQDLLFF